MATSKSAVKKAVKKSTYESSFQSLMDQAAEVDLTRKGRTRDTTKGYYDITQPRAKYFENFYRQNILIIVKAIGPFAETQGRENADILADTMQKLVHCIRDLKLRVTDSGRKAEE